MRLNTIKDKSWEISKSCLVLNWLCNLLPHNATHQGMSTSHDNASSEALNPSWPGEAYLPFHALIVSLYFIHHSLLMKCSHIHMQVIFAHNALVMGCFWAFLREQWFTTSRRVRLKSGAQVPKCHIILQLARREIWLQIMHLTCTGGWGAVTEINSVKRASLYLIIPITRRRCLMRMILFKDL